MTVRRWLAVAATAGLGLLAAQPAHSAQVPAPAPASAPQDQQPRVVAAGQSIQQAVDTAHPGDTILVQAGTYRENITITVPGLTLRGESADKVILSPPAVKTAATPGCADTGICVTGTEGHRLTDVRIASLTVTGFARNGIAASETDGLTVAGVRADGDGQYGIQQQKSVRARIIGNVARDNSEAGVFLANTVDEEGGALDLQGAVVAGNVLSGNKTGLVLRRIRDIAVNGNTVTDNCAGMFVVGDEGVPRAGHLSVRGNAVTANTRYCAANARLPFVQGAGIVLTGVESTVVERNTVTGNTGTSPMSGGVVFFHSFVNVPNTDNTVQDNVLLDNGPADLTGWDAGTGNSVTGNTCHVSEPTGRC